MWNILLKCQHVVYPTALQAMQPQCYTRYDALRVGTVEKHGVTVDTLLFMQSLTNKLHELNVCNYTRSASLGF